MVLVVRVCGEFRACGFFGEEFPMKSVCVSDVGVVGSGDGIVLFIGIGCQQMVFGCELEVMGRFSVSVECVIKVVVIVVFVCVVGHVCL